MPNKRRLSLSGPPTPARASETSSVHSVTASNDYIESLVNYFKENKDYNQFQYYQCVDKYEILSAVFEGETATGSQATSTFASPFSFRSRHIPATHFGGQSSSYLSEKLLTGDPDVACYDCALKVGRRRGSANVGATTWGIRSRQSKSSKSSDNLFVECANSLNNLASVKLQIKDRHSNDSEKYDVTIANQVVESFEGLSKGRKLAALLQLQDDKWRKAFLTMARDLQEYWIRNLEVPPQKGSDKE